MKHPKRFTNPKIKKRGKKTKQEPAQTANLKTKQEISDYISESRRRFIDHAIGITDEHVVAGLLYEAHNEGEAKGNSQGARVAAWSALADIRGMRKRTLKVEGGAGALADMPDSALTKMAGYDDAPLPQPARR